MNKADLIKKIGEILGGRIHDSGCFEYSSATVTQEDLDHDNKEMVDQLYDLIQEEKRELIEEIRKNLPKADKEAAIKHRPDNSVGFMLGWNAYSDELEGLLDSLTTNPQLNMEEEK